MATEIKAIEEFEVVRNDPANKGKAYIVPKEIFRHFTSLLNIEPIDASEVAELEELLGQRVDDVDLMGLTRSCVCPACDHQFNFADQFRAALNSGIHSREQLIEFTTSAKDGRFYLVVDTDQEIAVSCTSCGNDFSAIRCCYTTNSYAYA